MLQTLNLSHNSLKDLPDTLSNLSRLKTFDITYNPKLKKLPKSLAKCHAIEKFLVTDGNAVQYPSSDICQKGTEAIMKFLCKGKTSSIFMSAFINSWMRFIKLFYINIKVENLQHQSI